MTVCRRDLVGRQDDVFLVMEDVDNKDEESFKDEDKVICRARDALNKLFLLLVAVASSLRPLPRRTFFFIIASLVEVEVAADFF